jgi:hypothetical protein
VTFLLDEAYGSCGGNHLCPFTKYQLDKAYREGGPDKELYYQMRAFNHVLSSLRIHIERCFGLFCRMWGIMWKPLAHRLARCTLFITVCAKLHNLCVQHWMDTHAGSSDGYADSILPSIGVPHMATAPTDAEVVQRFTNQINSADRAVNPNARTEEMHRIYHAGIVLGDATALAGLPGNHSV